jgi:hypothetical protein
VSGGALSRCRSRRLEGSGLHLRTGQFALLTPDALRWIDPESAIQCCHARPPARRSRFPTSSYTL